MLGKYVHTTNEMEIIMQVQIKCAFLCIQTRVNDITVLVIGITQVHIYTLFVQPK